MDRERERERETVIYDDLVTLGRVAKLNASTPRERGHRQDKKTSTGGSPTTAAYTKYTHRVKQSNS